MEPNQTAAIWPDTHTGHHSIPCHFPSYLLSVFPKCSKLLSLFWLLHGGLFSLQLLSNLKHKICELMLFKSGMTALLGALEQETGIPWSANYGAQRNLVNNLFQDLGFTYEDNAAQRLSTLRSIPNVSVGKQELESNLPTPGVPFAPLYKTACYSFAKRN